jgi:hypothetical protein
VWTTRANAADEWDRGEAGPGVSERGAGKRGWAATGRQQAGPGNKVPGGGSNGILNKFQIQIFQTHFKLFQTLVD